MANEWRAMRMVLPKDYENFSTMEFCSNSLDAVLVPIALGERVPVLIGKGSPCQIWLAGTWQGKWTKLVEANKALLPEAKVRLTDKMGEVDILGTPILRVRVEKTPRVELLDLRPLGLDIHGSSQGLDVGFLHLENNRFSNLNAMVAATSGEDL